ncbi:MAG: insulinase family protein, partial [Gemmatimonadales bacterium]|nr:insulinase family protein [Gemmatimonadales bacterium]
PAAVALPHDTAAVLEDRVQLARLYYVWPTVPGLTPDDAPLELLAYLLAGEKNSRLTEALVHDDQTASSVWAYQDGKRVGGDFWVVATAKPEQALTGLQPTIDRELRRLAAEGPTARELEQAINALEASFLRRIETVNGKADMLNGYFVRTGHADGFAADLARYRAITAADIQRVATRYLTQPRVTLSVVPQGKPELAATPVEGTP